MKPIVTYPRPSKGATRPIARVLGIGSKSPDATRRHKRAQRGILSAGVALVPAAIEFSTLPNSGHLRIDPFIMARVV